MEPLLQIGYRWTGAGGDGTYVLTTARQGPQRLLTEPDRSNPGNQRIIPMNIEAVELRLVAIPLASPSRTSFSTQTRATCC